MRIYNTLTRQKETFEPLVENHVGMYVCGPTVYNLIHVGNARPIVVFDAIRRYFIHKGYTVTYVQNYTDVDDKIIKRAKEESITEPEIAERYIGEVEQDMERLNALYPDIAPRVTREIPEIIEMVGELIEKGYAYHVNGSVFFSTRSFANYGKLSMKNPDDLAAGARIEVDEQKRDPLDFVLWKPTTDYGWDSPWGKGRPGWHIECSAMSRKYLGKTFDIHGAGADNVFPHNENEVAQSEAANGQTFARYWMHNGIINVDSVKMSKSLNNFFTVRDIVKEFSYGVVRFFILSAHYRSPINFSHESLTAASNALTRIKNCVTALQEKLGVSAIASSTKRDPKDFPEFHTYLERFEADMDDDFNTADAVSVIFEAVKHANVNMNDFTNAQAAEMHDMIMLLCGILGIDPFDIKSEASQDNTGLADEIDALVAKRTEARKNKDFKTADEIRNQLNEMGVVLTDTPDGVKWSFK